jgi:hypothetical protein
MEPQNTANTQMDSYEDRVTGDFARHDGSGFLRAMTGAAFVRRDGVASPVTTWWLFVRRDGGDFSCNDGELLRL